MTPKLVVAAIAALAIAVGLVLPAPHGEASRPQAREQIQTIEIGKG